jgi:ATP-binding cassette subfamily C protein CydC
VEEIQGLAELEALGAADMHAARIESAAREMDRRQRTMSSLQGLGEAGTIAAAALAAGAAAFILVPLVGSGRLPRADMAMLTVFMLASFETVLPLPSVIQRAGEMAAAARRLFEIIDAESGVEEPGVPVKLSVGSAVTSTVDISVRGLHFRYSEGQPWVLRGFSMDAPPGSRIGVVGPTGAGKSTLVSILLRFREYQAGSIWIRDAAAPGPAEVDLRSLGGEGARRLFSVVPQDPYLFHASIRENLLIANADAGDEELWSALRTSALSDLVASLPSGLDTLVGETGRELSIGEAQRMAIARSLLKSAPVYIFDEPTEGLDDSTAGAVLTAVEQRLRGKTLIIISHRDRDLRIVDTIFRIGLQS